MPSQTPNVFTYPRSEPGTTGHLDLVEPLRTLPRELADAIKGLNEEQLAMRAQPGGWCIREQIGHLRDNAEVEHKRLYMVSTQTDPLLVPYDQDAYAREHGYMTRPVADMLSELAAVREDTVHLLTTLVNWNWARTGQHPETGRRSIRQMVEYMVEHEAGHLSEIRRLRALAESIE